MSNPSPMIRGFDFSDKDIRRALSNDLFLMLTIFTAPLCNLSCPYCFTQDWNKFGILLDLDDFKSLFQQAKGLNSKSIWWVGQGEPFMVKWWKNLITKTEIENLWIGIFTNGALLDDDASKYILDKNVSLYMKLNSFDYQIQGKLIGSDGKKFLNKVVPRIEWFVKKGMAKYKRLAVETVITKLNYDEIPRLYRWFRDREIIPFVEMMEHACQGAVDLDVTPEQHVALFKELQRIDSEEYGYEWKLVPPWVAYRCRNIYIGLAVDAYGNVTPCSGMRCSLGNIREKSLEEIWYSEKAKALRDPSKMEPQPWNGNNLGFYGCKSHAYHLTSDPFATDPRCEWFKVT